MWNRLISIVTVIAIAGTLGALGYVLATPRVGETFTEFYLFGAGGKAENYPEELVVGKEARVIAGIINREYEPATYLIKVMIDGVENNKVGLMTLEHDEKWEGEVSFVPRVAGNSQEVEFFLYKNEDSEPHLKPLRLLVNVKE